MATDTQTTAGTTKAKGTRKNVAKGPREVFVLFQVLGDDGQPMQFSKDRIRLIKATRNAASALSIMDAGDHPFATYKAVTVEGR